jgi:hypothetical protein
MKAGLVLGGGLIAAVFFLLPALGVDANRGYSSRLMRKRSADS